MASTIAMTPVSYTSPSTMFNFVEDDLYSQRQSKVSFLRETTSVSSRSVTPSVVIESEDSETDDGSGYDTDLDIENDRRMRKKTPERDDIREYKFACESLSVVCQKAILGSLSESELNIAYRNIGPMGAKALAVGLLHNIHIEELNLSSNGLGGEGSTYICEMMLENDLIQKLDMSDNEMKRMGALAVGECMKHNKGLLYLNISGNHFEDCDADALANGICENENIRELDLSHNGLSIQGGRSLGLALAANFTLKQLSLSWNHFREQGAVSLCKGLEENYALTHINLSHNGLGYKGSLGISKMLKRNDIIKHLDISNNRITWDAALLIAKGLKNNESLEVLKIGQNPLTTTGCMDIIMAISGENSVLQVLDLEAVCVIGEFEMMATAIAQHRKFEYRHGGIVGTHDVLGERSDRKETPMQRVMKYMKKTGLRATELFRNMDKDVSKTITRDEMIINLKAVGIDMKSHEVSELLEQLKRNATDIQDGDINYKNVARSVTEQIIRDRMERIDKREKRKKINRYHSDILRKGDLPPISDSSVTGDGKTVTFLEDSEGNYGTSARSSSRQSFESAEAMRSARSGTGMSNRPQSGTTSSQTPDMLLHLRRQKVSQALSSSSSATPLQRSVLKGNLSREKLVNRSISLPGHSSSSSLLGSTATMSSSNLPSLHSTPSTGKIMSMSKPLGTKAVAFGAANKTKRKKGKKGKKKGRKH